MYIYIPFKGKVCAWDIITTTYPEFATFVEKLEELYNDLRLWKVSSESLANTLPSIINGLQNLKTGKGMNPKLQSEIQNSFFAFEILKNRTDSIDNKLTDMINLLSDVKSGLIPATKNPFVGKLISPLVGYINKLKEELVYLRNKVQDFSNELAQEELKLSDITSYATKKKTELYNLWKKRKNAEFKVYYTLIAIAAIFLIIFGLIIMRRKGLLKIKGEESGQKINIKIAGGLMGIILGTILLMQTFNNIDKFINSRYSIYLPEDTLFSKVILLLFMLGIGTYITYIWK